MVKKVSSKPNLRELKDIVCDNFRNLLGDRSLGRVAALIAISGVVFWAGSFTSSVLKNQEINELKRKIDNAPWQAVQDLLEALLKSKTKTPTEEEKFIQNKEKIKAGFIKSEEVEFIGKIVDTDNEPIYGAEISIAYGPVTYSDYNGEFKIRCRIRDILNIKKGGYDHEKVRVTEDVKKLSVILQKAE